MSCYHPLKGFDSGYVNPKTGKPVLIRKSYDTEYVLKPRSVELALENSQRVQDVFSDFRIYKSVDLCCGQCIGCRLSYSRLWADRCTLEANGWKNNVFLTLTYDTQFLKYVECIDIETGEILYLPTLVKNDLKKFLKDLRRYYKYHYNIDNIRFYACGEYGTAGGRPHFHLIMFNMDVYDKQFFFRNFEGDNIYLSDTIRKIWKKGNVSVGEVSWNSIAYTARYVIKKQKGKTKGLVDWCGHLIKGLEPEYTESSRKPGIAREYYEEHKDHIYTYDEIVISKGNKVKTIKPPKYFDRLFDLDSPEAMKAIKEQRRETAESAMALELERTSLTKEEYLAVKERDQIYKLKALKRNMKEI